MRPIRVLYLIDSLGPGGAQRQLATLVGSLDRQLVAPEVAVYYPLSRFRSELDESQVPVHTLRGAGGRDPRVLARIARLLSRGRFDIVHSFLRTPGTLARLAAPFSRGARIIVSERSVNLGMSRVRVAVERALNARADAMIVNADATRREVERLVPAWSSRIHVVPNGIAWHQPSDSERRAGEEFRHRHLGDADVLLGVVGRVYRAKAPDLLVEALERIPEDVRSRMRVVWVGSRHDEELAMSIEERLDAAGLGGRLSFLGETDDTRSVYLGIDGLVLPSRWEAFPNAVLEAMAHGAPVVATDVGDTARLLEGGGAGWLVQPDDAGALAGAVCELVQTSREELAKMGRLGSAFVLERYSAARLVDGTMAVYHKLLESGGTPSGEAAS